MVGIDPEAAFWQSHDDPPCGEVVSTVHRLVSGEKPVVGLRVFTNDWVWGTITKVAEGSVCGTYCEAWHEVALDGRDGTKIYNCDRLTTRKPT